jgi:hypothetical protein
MLRDVLEATIIRGTGVANLAAYEFPISISGNLRV